MTPFKSILRITTRNLAEKAGEEVFEAILGLVIQSSIRIVLGPVGFMLPVSKVAEWVTGIGFKTYREVSSTLSFKTSYNIHKTSSGVLVAENRNPSDLRKSPLPLPTHCEISWDEIRRSDPLARFFQHLNQHDIKATYAQLDIDLQECHECDQCFGMHLPTCPHAPGRWLIGAPLGSSQVGVSRCPLCGQPWNSHIQKVCNESRDIGW